MNNELTFHLRGKPIEDGRIYVTSPDLKGFHFLLEKEDDPLSAMKPALAFYLKHHLESDLKEVKHLASFREYKAQKLNIRDSLDSFPGTIMAAMA